MPKSPKLRTAYWAGLSVLWALVWSMPEGVHPVWRWVQAFMAVSCAAMALSSWWEWRHPASDEPTS